MESVFYGFETLKIIIMDTTKTKKYNYFYYGTPISKANFIKEVPDNWEDEVIGGAYSWGGYDAVEIDEDEE